MRPRRRRWLLWLWLAACCVPLAAYYPHAGYVCKWPLLLIGTDFGGLILSTLDQKTPYFVAYKRGPVYLLPIVHISERFVFLPVWLISACCISSGLLFRRLTRPRRSACARCGYDLTGNVSGICPECGRATDPTRAAADSPTQAR